MALMATDEVEAINTFLLTNFHRGPFSQFEFEEDMADYAACGKFLSVATANNFKTALQMVAIALEDAYSQALDYDPNTNTRRVGAFSIALGEVARRYGFNRQVLMLNGKQKDPNMLNVIGAKHLFRDVYTSPHGEFTHALQWLALAEASTAFGIGLLGLDIPRLYSRSMQYISKKTFLTWPGTKEYITPWRLLVDCFEDTEDYHANVRSETFRCPQVFTKQLASVLPTQSWLAVFIHHRATKFNPYKKVTKGAKQLSATHSDQQGAPVNRYIQYRDSKGNNIPVYSKNPQAIHRKDL